MAVVVTEKEDVLGLRIGVHLDERGLLQSIALAYYGFGNVVACRLGHGVKG